MVSNGRYLLPPGMSLFLVRRRRERLVAGNGVLVDIAYPMVGVATDSVPGEASILQPARWTGDWDRPGSSQMNLIITCETENTVRLYDA